MIVLGTNISADKQNKHLNLGKERLFIVAAFFPFVYILLRYIKSVIGHNSLKKLRKEFEINGRNAQVGFYLAARQPRFGQCC